MRREYSTIVKRLRSLGHHHGTWEVFRDFLELAAIAFSNAVDIGQRAEREARYMRTIKTYTKEEALVFPEILGELQLALEEEAGDVLGRVFTDLELASKWGGQFFTPQSLADVMGAMVLDEGARQTIAARGFITLQEPAVGGGALVIGFCNAMRAAGLDYRRQLHVTAIDVDEKAVHMAYVQLSLLGVPAVVIQGNTLSLEERAHWYTPAHVLGGWSAKLRSLIPQSREIEARVAEFAEESR